MSVLTEFATFITLNLANLATTYARLLAEHNHGYKAIPVNNRLTSGRKLLKAVSEACEMESSVPLRRLFAPQPLEVETARWPGHIVPPDPLQEVECLGQTLTPVVTNLEAGKFLWQILAETRAAIRLDFKPAGPVVPTSTALTPAAQPDQTGDQPQSPSAILGQEYNSEHKVPLMDEAGRVVGLVGISRDITERKQIEEALAKRVQELNCLNEIGREMEEMTPLPELLLWVTQRIPEAMQYPALSRVAITFEEQLYGLAEAIDLPAQMTHGLYIKGEVLGRIYIAYTEQHDFLDEESAMLGAIATRLSGYIENQRLLRETEAALVRTEILAREQTVLKELGQALTARLNVQEVLQEAYRQTSRLIDTTNFYIGLYDPAKEEISFPLQVSESQIDMEITVIKASQGLAGYMVRNRVGLLFEDDVRARQEALGITMVGEEAKSWLGVPLLIGDEVLGVMAVQSHTTPNLYQEHDRELLTAIANQVAIALQNVRQFEQTQAALAVVQQSQELLRSIIDATPDWIFIKDREYRYRLVNQGYANSLHLPPADFIGRNDLELGFPEDIVKGNPEKGIRGFWADDREVMERGEIKLVEVEPAVVDDRPIFLRTVKVPLRDAAGEVWGVLGFVSNITAQQQLLAEVERRAQREQTIREITDKMRAAASLEQLLKTVTTELGERLSAGHAVVELGFEPTGRQAGEGNRNGH